jgi:hypothetical protein
MTPRMVERPSSSDYGATVKQEYLLGCYPERSSLLIGAVFCIIVGLSLVLVIISPGW